MLADIGGLCWLLLLGCFKVIARLYEAIHLEFLGDEEVGVVVVVPVKVLVLLLSSRESRHLE